MLAHLWANQPAPREYIEYTICERFHCLPKDLDEESYIRVMSLLICMNGKDKVEAKRNQFRNRGKRKQ